jgi:hypothetical protein
MSVLTCCSVAFAVFFALESLNKKNAFASLVCAINVFAVAVQFSK